MITNVFLYIGRNPEAMPRSSSPINMAAFGYYPSLKRIRDYFENNYSAPVSLAQAAQVAGLETKHFSKFFRSKIGIGFKEWTNVVRIQRAVDAIQDQHDSLSEIALAVGFQNIRTFQRAFKKHAGVTASTFQRTVIHHLGDRKVA